MIDTHEFGLHGALQLKVPCSCSLSQSSLILIHKVFPCDFSGNKPFQMYHILPALWSKLQTLYVPSVNHLSQLSYRNASECLNLEWNVTVPHFNFVPSFVNREDELEPYSITPYSQQSLNIFQLTSIFTTVCVFIIIIRNPALIGLGLVQNVNALVVSDSINYVCSTTAIVLIIVFVSWLIYLCIKRNKRREDVQIDVMLDTVEASTSHEELSTQEVKKKRCVGAKK